MHISQVALQLNSLRNFCKTPQETAQTFKKLRAIGFQAVEVAGIAAMPATELLAMLRGEGLTCCATHEPPLHIIKEPRKIIERLQLLHCSYAVIPSPPAYIMRWTLNEMQTFATALDAAGKTLHEAGISLAYHNHSFDFVKCGDRTVLEILFAATNPHYLQAELDVYDVQYGGGDPVAWCKQLKDRLPLLHMRDYKIDPEEFEPTPCEIGAGTLNWKELIQAAEYSHCRWFIVEQDRHVDDPFASLNLSFQYLQNELCSTSI